MTRRDVLGVLVGLSVSVGTAACGLLGLPRVTVVRDGVTHVVRPGQTLYRIAKTYGVDMEYLAGVNGIADPDRIQVGDRIFIPGARRVRRVKVYRPEQSAALAGKLPAEPHTGPPPRFTWPVRGKVVSRFGLVNGFKNNGVAIAAEAGTPVRAAAEGKVVYSGAELRDYGNLVIIGHPSGYATVYAHNRINRVRQSEQVAQGQVIAEVGQTGIVESPVLYFEIRSGAVARDPIPLLP